MLIKNVEFIRPCYVLLCIINAAFIGASLYHIDSAVIPILKRDENDLYYS